VLERLLARRCHAGVADGLARLKRRAENPESLPATET
jgi:hypothetical protein